VQDFGFDWNQHPDPRQDFRILCHFEIGKMLLSRIAQEVAGGFG